jgi:hypothetical protein
MKDVLFKSVTKLSWLIILAMIGFTFSSCEDDDDGNGNGDEVVLDGIYVKGPATAYGDEFSSDAKMTTTKNEVIQEERTTLYEIFLPLKGGESFSITQVAGDERMTYGPGSDFAVVPAEDRTTDEPQVDFKRGSYTETESQFTVSEDGLYHIAMDTEVGKIVVVPVDYWGLIGGATPGGWSEDTKMMPTGFDQNSMTFEITDVELRGGEWKFRYSGGWKVALDTTLDIGDGNVGVKVNTNLGGSASSLEAGGANISNDNPGIYNASLTWTEGEGYAANMEKTGEIPNTDWTGVDLDIVGDGVSPDNTNAIDDTSSWNWGYALLADNDGNPTKDGEVYYWNWTEVVLEANAGFKVRTENGMAAPENDLSFDLGYGDVDTDNSSSLVGDSDGNIIVTEKGTFNIEVTIDAANSDEKTVVITEAAAK